MNNSISLQELSEKLNGKYWEKGDKKRIYLDRGHNTKKMSTKTFVWQNESGDFHVSCYIECPSQAWQWIQSQQEQIIESVNEDIDQTIWEINNPGLDYDEYLENKEIEIEYTGNQSIDKNEAARIEEIQNLSIENVWDFLKGKGHIDLSDKLLWNMQFNHSQFITQSRFLNKKDDYAPVIYDHCFERIFLKSERHADQNFSKKLGKVKVGESTLEFDDIVDFVFVRKQGTNGSRKKNVFRVVDIPQDITDQLNAQLEIEKGKRIEYLTDMVKNYKEKLLQSIEDYKIKNLR